MAKAAPTTPSAPKLCGCGCKAPVERSFKQGHDQILVAKLAADLVIGTGRGLNLLPKEDAGLDIQERINRVVEKVRGRFSDALAAKVNSAAMNLWTNAEKRAEREATRITKRSDKPARVRKTKKVAEAATPEPTAEVPLDYGQEAEPTVSGPKLGAQVRVKVNRYTYDATVVGMSQAGKVTAITYTNGAGQERTINDPAKINIIG